MNMLENHDWQNSEEVYFGPEYVCVDRETGLAMELSPYENGLILGDGFLDVDRAIGVFNSLHPSEDISLDVLSEVERNNYQEDSFEYWLIDNFVPKRGVLIFDLQRTDLQAFLDKLYVANIDLFESTELDCHCRVDEIFHDKERFSKEYEFLISQTGWKLSDFFRDENGFQIITPEELEKGVTHVLDYMSVMSGVDYYGKELYRGPENVVVTECGSPEIVLNEEATLDYSNEEALSVKDFIDIAGFDEADCIVVTMANYKEIGAPDKWIARQDAWLALLNFRRDIHKDQDPLIIIEKDYAIENGFDWKEEQCNVRFFSELKKSECMINNDIIYLRSGAEFLNKHAKNRSAFFRPCQSKNQQAQSRRNRMRL